MGLDYNERTFLTPANTLSTAQNLPVKRNLGLLSEFHSRLVFASRDWCHCEYQICAYSWRGRVVDVERIGDIVRARTNQEPRLRRQKAQSCPEIFLAPSRASDLPSIIPSSVVPVRLTETTNSEMEGCRDQSASHCGVLACSFLLKMKDFQASPSFIHPMRKVLGAQNRLGAQGLIWWGAQGSDLRRTYFDLYKDYTKI